MGERAVLVCGGGGVGSAVAARFAADPQVRTVVVDHNPELARWQSAPVDFRITDLADPSRLRRALDGIVPAVCVYAAGPLTPAFDEETGASGDGLDAFAGFLRFVTGLPGGPRLVLCSSLAVYGANARGAAEQTPLEPVSAYGANKLATERMLAPVARAASLPFTILRFCGIVGPIDRPGGGWMHTLLARTVAQARSGSPMNVPHRLVGEEYLHVEDAAAAAVLATSPGRRSGVLNVGSGVVPSKEQLLSGLAALSPDRTGSPPGPIHPTAAAGPGLDTTAIRAQTGYRPRFDTLDAILASIVRPT